MDTKTNDLANELRQQRGRSHYVVEELKRAIEQQELKAGEKLPSNEALADMLGVGRSSIREGIKQLQALGLLNVRQGLGTFVAEAKVEYGSTRMRSFSDAVRALNMEPGAKILELGTIEATPAIAEKLMLSPGDPVHRVYRLRLANDMPMAIEESFVPAAHAPDLLDPVLWTPNTSMYALLRDRYNLAIHHAVQVVEIATLKRPDSQMLQVAARSSALQIETSAFLADGTAIEYGVSLYRADRYKYIVQLSV